MQRVRVGAIGLACVFLLVLLAASLFGLVRKDTPAERIARGDNMAVAAGNTQDAPKEPLAELGVAPGNPTQFSIAPRAVPAAPRQASPSR